MLQYPYAPGMSSAGPTPSAMGAFPLPRTACYNGASPPNTKGYAMIYVGLHTLLPPPSVYFTPPTCAV